MGGKKHLSDTAQPSPTPDPGELVIQRVGLFLADPTAARVASERAAQALPEAIIDQIANTMNSQLRSYPVALAIQFACGVALRKQVPVNITERQPGMRGAKGVAGRVAKYLKSRSIPTVDDAFQNIGKNTTTLNRGNMPAFDALLPWGANATVDQLNAALDLAAIALASQSRPVSPMPTLRQSTLTFATMMGLFDDLFSRPSEGAHEQFVVACLLESLLAQYGPSNLRVQTRHINASDKSSSAAGDVQVMMGHRVIEAFEVSGNDWSTKVDAAAGKLAQFDLPRIHIVARLPDEESGASVTALTKIAQDVSVLDLRMFVANVTGLLLKPQRAMALGRLYELLNRNQPKVELVNAYVDLLQSRGLSE